MTNSRQAEGAGVGRQLVILAGGKGTRLGARAADNPKPMVPVAGRPLLEHHLELARRHGVEEVVLLLGYRSEKIVAHFGEGERFGVRLRYVIESQPLGTAGALVGALPELDEAFTVLYGDTMLDVDLARMWRLHRSREAEVTLFVHPNDHPADSDLVEADADGRVLRVHGYPHPPGANLQNLVNAALYIFQRPALGGPNLAGRKFDVAKHLLPELIEKGGRIFAYKSREYIKDMGTPERLDRVDADVRAGKVAARRATTACAACFLDRDGTLNVEVNRVSRVEDMALLPGAAAAVRRLNRAGWLTPVVTNQPVIARGDCTEVELRAIHNRMETLLGVEGAFVDEIYYCPHHPTAGFPGERKEFKIECDCRKPRTGLLERAIAELNIDRSRSWMIGDTTSDVACAQRAGLISALVRTGHAGRDGRDAVAPDFEFFDLADAVAYLLDAYPQALARARNLSAAWPPGEVVALGGLARSGKSAFASVLKLALRERGVRAAIVPLDGFLLSVAQRAPDGPWRGFDVAAIARGMDELRGRSPQREATIALGRYDRDKRECIPAARTLTVKADEVAIVEGVPALALESVRAVAQHRLYVEVGDATRRARFERDYALRGHDATEIARLFAAREAGEHPAVVASRDWAEATVNGGEPEGAMALAGL